MKNKKIVVLLVICSFLLPIVLSSDDWPMFRHDPQHTGYTDCEMPNELELLWKYGTDSNIASSPAVVNGKVYFGSWDGYLYCLDTNGKLLWKYGTDSNVFSSPAVVNGKVYFGSCDNYL
ncbi:MAG TPA: serine/threonine protein kinase, partial [Candidatus Atribacteria bacterium]|nr:serine/threonine protein kinase [Candidatus Atribacteria bacterium]